MNPEEIKALQQKLQAEGLYAGPIDGVMGPKTQEAAAQLRQIEQQRQELQASQAKAEAEERADRIREKELQLEERKLQQTGSQVDVANKEAEERIARQQEYNRQAGSTGGLVTQSAASILAPATGTAAGYRLGGILNDRLNEGQANRNEVLRGVAQDRIRGLTTRDGAAMGARLSGAMPSENAMLRVAARGAPHIGLGGIAVGKGVQLLSDVDEDQPFYPRMGDRAAGLGYIGFGAGMAKRGIEQMASPKVPPDAQALGVINSTQLRRNGPGGRNVFLDQAQDRGAVVDAETVPEQRALPGPRSATEPLKPGTAAYMRQQLKKDYGVRGTDRMNKAQLASKLSEVTREHGSRRTVGKRGPKAVPGVLGPVIGAGAAYFATPDDAQASTGGGSVTGQDEALTNAALAGGATYGVNRLLSAIPRVAGAVAGEMVGPVAAMTGPDFTPETEEFGRNAAVRDMPWLRHVAPIYSDAFEKAQVPERGRMPTPDFEEPDEFAQHIAELQAILQEMGQSNRPAARPAPAPPAYEQNRLLQP